MELHPLSRLFEVAERKSCVISFARFSVETARVLIDEGKADLDATDKKDGRTALMILTSMWRPMAKQGTCRVETQKAKLLADANADVLARSHAGLWALDVAREKNARPIERILCARIETMMLHCLRRDVEPLAMLHESILQAIILR
mmetsp:Transcript_14692/g.27897  ORF Transcript_14692/g.27897 Transcript_14692/m.27897 type:complete len:146 (+) Transcript_14692:342-779(+)